MPQAEGEAVKHLANVNAMKKNWLIDILLSFFKDYYNKYYISV